MITVPAVWGEDDRTVPTEHADRLVGLPPRGRRRKVVIAGGSHAPYMSDAAALYQERPGFLAEVSGTGTPCGSG